MRKIKLKKDTEITVDVIEYVLDLHKEEARRINKLKDYSKESKIPMSKLLDEAIELLLEKRGVN